MDRVADRQGGARAVERYEPGRDAAERYPDWVIRHRDLRGIPEVLSISRRVILVDRGQHVGARRSALAHAIAHLDLEHVSIDGFTGMRQERDAERLAARRLIPVAALVDALLWAHNEAEAADELRCDVALLRARLATLHPSERSYLERKITKEFP